MKLAYRSFAAGEVSRRLGARVDQNKYQTGAYTMRNMVSTLEGAVTNRSGFGFVRPCWGFTADYAPRQLPFVFSDDQSYDIILEDGRLSVISAAAPQFDTTTWPVDTTSAIAPLTITSVGHGLSNGDMVYIDGVEGAIEVNRRFFMVANATANAFEAHEEGAVDPDAYGPYSVGGTIQRVYSITAPWSGADLRQIRVAQTADVMILVHPDYPVYVLTRTAGPVWTLATATFDPNISTPFDGALTGTGGAVTTRYQVAAVDADTLEESYPGYGNTKAFNSIQKGGGLPVSIVTTANHGYATGEKIICRSIVDAAFTFLNNVVYVITVTGATSFTLDGSTLGGGVVAVGAVAGNVQHNQINTSALTAPSSANPITVAWTAVSGALEYNVYREINGVFGYIGTSATASFQDLGYDVDPFDTPPIDRDVFSVTDEYPAAVGLFQQRLLLGGSTNSPERIDAGRTGLLYNFTKSNPIQADDSFSWVMRSNQVQGIRHILEMSRCLVFTQSSIFTLEGDDAGALVPTAINPRKRAEHGLGDVPPIAIGNAVIYVQAFGKIVREILPGTGEDFNSKDLTVYARHLFDRNAVVSWSYSEEPSSLVWAARDDGTLLGFTYLREHEVWGWHRHDTGAGDKFIDVCSIPEGEETITYAVVQRFGVGGGDRYYIERMASRQVAHQADGRFLDSYRYQEDANDDVGNTYRLNYDDTYSTGTDRWWLEPTGGTSPFTEGEASPDIGRVILLYGTNGERYWCTILEVNTQFQVFVSVRTDISGEYDDTGAFLGAIGSDGAPTDLFPETLPYTTSVWSQSVSVLTDLWHLEGRGVRVVGDGSAQGPFVVTDGAVTLLAPAAQVVCGLQVVSDLVTLEPDNPQGGTWTGMMKTVSEVDVRVEETDGLRVGTSWSTLTPWRNDKRLDKPLPVEGQPYTGQYRASLGGTRTSTGRVHLRQSDGLPTTILGVYPEMDLAR